MAHHTVLLPRILAFRSFQEFFPPAGADDAGDSEYVPTKDEAEEEDGDAASQRATAGDPVNEDFLPYYALRATYPPRGVIGVGGAVQPQHFEPLAPLAVRPVPLLEQLDALAAQAHAAHQRDYSALPPPVKRPRTPINAQAPQVPAAPRASPWYNLRLNREDGGARVWLGQRAGSPAVAPYRLGLPIALQQRVAPRDERAVLADATNVVRAQEEGGEAA
ncbi:hypothetical protein AURDEDRAFT_176632 [Auricularia subglabra TFB-10046 SS5]|uniref:Uncharacterized protein n=1 Tax=Auricularia subglabra (strain TFB-10046 / SS5) TaxID=717982 RepID=J0WPH5_AURST|nr:hypothetical protein AURDEDRAFT_176632 [Auricularia subglabra TFB-10046 SS5]